MHFEPSTSLTLRAVGLLRRVLLLSVGRSCAVLHNGTAKCWGANELHCGYDDARGLLGGAYGRGGTQTNINKYVCWLGCRTVTVSIRAVSSHVGHIASQP